MAVDDVSFEVGKGEMFGLLGPNGAGKTTTINMLIGAIKPSGGSVTPEWPARPHAGERATNRGHGPAIAVAL